MTLSPEGAQRTGAALIAFVMSGVMSGVMIALNAGLGPAFPVAWLKAWALGFVVSFPTASLIVPPIVRWTSHLRHDGEP